jgi:hypothetical protein
VTEVIEKEELVLTELMRDSIEEENEKEVVNGKHRLEPVVLVEMAVVCDDVVAAASSKEVGNIFTDIHVITALIVSVV